MILPTILLIVWVACCAVFTWQIIKIAKSAQNISKRKAKKIREILGDK